jgi:hypothetical protein
MKNVLFALPAILLFSACGSHSGDPAAKPKNFPKPGTIVAKAEEHITEDKLNDFTYKIAIVADSNITSGMYDVDVDFGPNFAEGQLAMPKGAEDLRPELRKGTEPYTYIIGFHIAGDTTFYDYYKVSSSRNNTKMEYIKAYSF